MIYFCKSRIMAEGSIILLHDYKNRHYKTLISKLEKREARKYLEEDMGFSFPRFSVQYPNLIVY
jgi:hypothetical protein